MTSPATRASFFCASQTSCASELLVTTVNGVENCWTFAKAEASPLNTKTRTLSASGPGAGCGGGALAERQTTEPSAELGSVSMSCLMLEYCKTVCFAWPNRSLRETAPGSLAACM